MSAERVQITMLNSMASEDFAESLDLQKEWGIEAVDLKNAIFGKPLLELTDEEAGRARGMIEERGLSVCCLSSGLFLADVEEGEAAFVERQLGRVGRLVEFARIFRPEFVRLLAARTRRRGEVGNAVEYLRSDHIWIFDLYRRAVGEIARAGFRVTIENEVHGCVLSRPEEVTGFFAELGCGGEVCFTWDVQNMWQMGTFPSLEAYSELADLIGYYHLKGGRTERPGGPLRFKSTLEEADWPVTEITASVVRDGVTAICLNPSHGEAPEGYDPDDAVRRDLAFARAIVEGA
jgi:sugar phosphate isomerase/epimerase